MASTVTAASLKVTINENITLNGRQQGGSQIFTIGSIKDIHKRIVTIASGDDATIAVFKSTVAISDGALDKELVKYIRVTNLDDTNAVNLSLQLDSGEDNSAADLSVTHLLKAGQSFLMGTVDEAVHADDDGATLITALTDVESILIDPGSNVGTIELFVASI